MDMQKARGADREQERAQSLRALEAARARYENLYQDAPDMFASVTVDTERVVQCNATLLRATGYRRTEVLGRPVRELHDPGSAAALGRRSRRPVRTAVRGTWSCGSGGRTGTCWTSASAWR